MKLNNNMKTNDELIEEITFRDDGYRITAYKGDEMLGVVTEYKHAEYGHLFQQFLTQKDAEVARERERIVEIVKGKELLEVAFDSDSLMWKQRINALLKDIISLITNKGDTNN